MKRKMGFIVLLICIIAFWILPINAESTEQSLKNTTRVYFCSEITKGYGAGDCILLENTDSKGNKLFGLIDTGRNLPKTDENGNSTTVVKEFLRRHGVDKLEFLVITHIHGDHAGDALTVLDNFSINRIYLKEFDSYFSEGAKQSTYENILRRAITKNISVVGVSAESLHSDSLSPNRTTSFKNYINSIGNTKDGLFSSFNENNIEFDFGSSTIKIFNWEIFAEDGSQFISGITTDKKKEYVINENNNSLGVLLTQGSKKAFFSGDMNNLDKNDKTGRIGDEDRLKDEIGKIDLLKLGHHGYKNSNTMDYMNTLKPEYVVITNDEGEAIKEIKDWLNDNETKYMYSTQDEFGVSATITNDEIYLGCETTNSFQRIKGEVYYVPDNCKYSDYSKSFYRLEYENKEIEVNSWQSLKQAIDSNKKEKKRIDNDNKICYLYRLKVKMNTGGDWTAKESIEIEGQQEIILDAGNKTNNVITIYRENEVKDIPLFLVHGKLSLGTDEMKGKIILDGNKNNDIESSTAMIKISYGTLNIYNNVTLCNNMNKTTEKTLDDDSLREYISYGSAIFAEHGILNMYGGEIINNSQEVSASITYPISNKEETYNYYFGVQGTGIYLKKFCEFNMYGGTISNNTAINNSKFDLNSDINIDLSDKSLSQNCGGVGIFAKGYSKINLLGGKISGNRAINNAQTLVDTSEVNNSFKSISDCIYGVGIDVADCDLSIHNGFEISENSAENNSTIGQNAKNVVASIRGGQLYTNSTNLIIDGKDNLVTISNFEATKNVQINGNNSAVNNKDYGGALFLSQGTNYNFNKMKITECEADRGGAIYTSSCVGVINNSTITGNTAIEYGGAIYNSNSNCDMEINNTEISNNSVTAGHGGGIYATGSLIINGNTVISNNTASKSGGGIKVGKNGRITIYGGLIKENSAGTNGGGIDYSETNAKVYLNNGTIENNTATGNGNDSYPTEDIPEDKNNPVLELGQIPNEFTNKDIDITITVSDEESGVKLVTINDEKIASKDGIYVYSIKENGEYIIIVKDYAGNTTTETLKVENKIDKIRPKIIVSPDYSTSCKTKEITITASDDGCSGLSDSNNYQYYLSTSNNSLEGGSWKNYTNGTKFIIGSGITGKRYLFVKSVEDNVGNISISDGTRTKIGNEVYQRFGTYIFDNEAPKAVLSPNGKIFTILSTESAMIRTNITVEDNESDLGTLQYAWSNSSTVEPTDWTTFTNGSEVSKSDITSEGTWYIWTKLTDSLGNTETKKVGNAFIIKESDIEIAIKVDNSEWNKSGVKVALYQNGVSKATTTVNNGNIASFIDVENGTYDVYAGKHSGAKTELIDTGLDITINNNKSIGNIINYYSLQLVKGTGISGTNQTGYTGAKTRYYLYKNSGTQQDIAIDATVSEGYNWENWTKTSDSNLTKFDASLKSQNIKMGAGPTVLTANAKVKDTISPIITVNDEDESICKTKKIIITATDEGSGLSSNNSYQYYLSTSSTALSGGTWINYTNGIEFTIGNGITGKRYLFVKRVSDNAENISSKNGTLVSINNEQYQRLGCYNFLTPINIEKMELQLDNNNFTYTGTAIKPNITLKNGNNYLTQNKDYTISFSNNVNIGVATVTVNGIGSYSGKIARNYIIIPAKVSGLESSKQDSYSVTLKWNEMNGVTGYEIYQYDKTKDKYVYIKTVNGNSKKIRELSPKKSYKFKVRAFVTIDNKKYYGAFSDKKKFATGTKKPKINKINSKKRKATIQWNKVSGAKGYKIYMATSKNGEYKWIKNVKTTQYIKSKLKKNKKYYFKIRTYRIVNGKKVYSSYSEIKKIKIK